MYTTGDIVIRTDYWKDRIYRVVSYMASKDMYKVEDTSSKDSYLVYPEFLLPYQDTPKKPDGGPADYYDIPYKAHTLNDLLEYKGEYHWRGDSFHLANLVKAAWRWGVKQGTTEAYDARKFIYSGARLLMKYAGVKELRDTLQRMLDDPQFKEDDK